MSGFALGALVKLLPVGIQAYFGVKQQQATDAGVNQEKANEGNAALKDAADAQAISGDVDRMSDSSVRDSPYANNRDR